MCVAVTPSHIFIGKAVFNRLLSTYNTIPRNKSSFSAFLQNQHFWLMNLLLLPLSVNLKCYATTVAKHIKFLRWFCKNTIVPKIHFQKVFQRLLSVWNLLFAFTNNSFEKQSSKDFFLPTKSFFAITNSCSAIRDGGFCLSFFDFSLSFFFLFFPFILWFDVCRGDPLTHVNEKINYRQNTATHCNIMQHTLQHTLQQDQFTTTFETVVPSSRAIYTT